MGSLVKHFNMKLTLQTYSAKIVRQMGSWSSRHTLDT